MWGARLQRPWKRSRTVPVYTKVSSFKMECIQLTLAWLTFHYERLMGLVRQRSEAFGPVHYEGYIWHWSARQPIALHCWVPAAPDVRWVPGPQSFNRAGIVLYLNSLAFSPQKKHSHAHVLTHTNGFEKTCIRQMLPLTTPSQIPIKCDGESAVLTNTSMWKCDVWAGPKFKHTCFSATWGIQDITKDFLNGE